jgi:hypothetical protein
MFPPPDFESGASTNSATGAFLRMILSENRYPFPVKSGAGFFGTMRHSAGIIATRRDRSTAAKFAYPLRHGALSPLRGDR